MKLIFIATLAMALGVLAGKPPVNGKPPIESKYCEIMTEWGYGWCTKPPFNWRCTMAGRRDWDKWDPDCERHSACRCDSE